MARFRARIAGQRGEASRLGSAVSGITANVDGWDAGVSVSAHTVDMRDEFHVYATSGSNNSAPPFFVGHVDFNGTFIPSNELRERILRQGGNR